MIAHRQAPELEGPRVSRGEALARLLYVAELLRQFRFGLTLDFVHRETSERTGRPWHPRTIRRDIALLERVGVVERTGYNPCRWQWTGLRPLIETRPETVTGRRAS